MPRIECVRGDITVQDVDAIVNAANSSLAGGGGVDGAIHARGGPQILAECMQIREARYPRGLPTGDAVATSGGKLRARFVIHTVGPVFSKTVDRSEQLASAHRRSLEVADEIGARAIAFPAISCGIYGYPLELAAPIALSTVRAATTNVELVRFVLFDARAFEAFVAARDARDV